MASFTQHDRPVRIDSPLGEDKLLVDQFDGSEALSALFAFRLALRSSETSIDPNQLIGQSVTISVDRTDGSGDARYFNGIVTQFENMGMADRDMALYSAEVGPKLWLATQRSDNRIFQNRTSVEIVKQVLQAFDVTIDAGKVNPAPPQREYCVQYGESDFQFVSRLLEEDGVFYYFKHEDGKHTMVLGNGPSALGVSDESSVSYHGTGQTKDRLLAWSHGYGITPGKWAHGDYNFQTPDDRLRSNGSAGTMLPQMAKLERYEYPGAYQTASEGERRGGIRAAQNSLYVESVNGQSAVETFSPGLKFSIKAHESEAEQGKSYVLTSVQHSSSQKGAYEGGESSQSARYTNHFVAVPAETQLRPSRLTPKPRMLGPQTAIVVGPQGEEIWTDKYGRVKVNFFWDRASYSDENSSCWLRVAFASAGAGWGLLALPRVGYEVMVDFLEGDPDRPMVTGCVYNANNMPPLSTGGRGGSNSSVPAARWMTTLRSWSQGKGGGFNEITLNDTQGDETLFLKAEKDEIHNVGHDNNGDRTLTIAQNDKITVGADRTTSITNNEKLTVGADQTTSISNNDKLSVGSNQTIDVGGDLTESVTGTYSETAQQITLTGQTSITLQCGGSTIQLTPSMITINGPMVMIN